MYCKKGKQIYCSEYDSMFVAYVLAINRFIKDLQRKYFLGFTFKIIKYRVIFTYAGFFQGNKILCLVQFVYLHVHISFSGRL